MIVLASIGSIGLSATILLPAGNPRRWQRSTFVPPVQLQRRPRVGRSSAVARVVR